MTGDTSKMRNTASEMKNNAKKYNDYIEQIYNMINTKLSSYWQGADYEQFKASCQKHRNSLDDLGKAIDGFGTALNNAADGLDKTVSKLKGVF